MRSHQRSSTRVLAALGSAAILATAFVGTSLPAASATPVTEARTATVQTREVLRPAQASTLPADVTFPGNDGRAHEVTWDGSSMMVDGVRTPILSGEFHYWRLPSPDSWRDVFQKMRAAGFNAVSLYFNWGYHSQKRGDYDFTGVRDIDRVMREAEAAGLYIIARPGPYIQAESSMGGLPNYMTTFAGIPRTTWGNTLDSELEWLREVDAIIAKHQITNGGGSVIAHQVENEMISPFTTKYMNILSQAVRDNGITVPLFHNDYSPGHGWFAPGSAGGKNLDLYAWDYYPLWFDCKARRGRVDLGFEGRVRGYSPNTPVFIAEGQGGAYTAWGRDFDTSYCNQFVDDKFVRQYSVNNLANGVTMHNTYMEYGGTNWGWTGDPGSGFTSYDYGAAIAEDRTMRPKLHVQKEFNYLQTAVPQLMTSRETAKPYLTVTGNRDVIGAWRTDKTPGGPGSVDGKGVYMLSLRHSDTNNEGTSWVLTSADIDGRHYSRVPEEPNTYIPINGRDAYAMILNLDFQGRELIYTTGQLAGISTHGDPVMVVTQADSEDSETVLRFARRPQVITSSDKVRTTWNEQRKELRVNLRHQGEQVVRIEAGAQSMTLLLTTRDLFQRFWLTDTGAGTIATAGADLVRTARLNGTRLDLTGDTSEPRTLRVFTDSGIGSVTWNGRVVPISLEMSGVLVADLPGPGAVPAPQASGWVARDGAPEARVDFDDSAWTSVDKTTVPNIVHGPGWAQRVTMDSDEYGFGDGDIWYRGHFTPWSGATSITVSARTGNYGMAQVWINGKYIGSQWNGMHTYWLNWNDWKIGEDNVIAILARNNGHDQEPLAIGISKAGRGIWDVAMPGARPAKWRIQGIEGGTTPLDRARGFANNGGQFGEREGWALPGAPDEGFEATGDLTVAQPGVRWFKRTVDLALPAGQDTHMVLTVKDSRFRTDRYRALLFVNGWQVGNYVNNAGPQRQFVIPSGILNSNGRNFVSVAVTAEEAGVGPEDVVMEATSSVAGGLPVTQNEAPSWSDLH